MKQNEILKKVNEVLFTNTHIDSAFIYGSMARKTASVNSDIDIAIVVSSNFNSVDLKRRLEAKLESTILKVLTVELRNKIVLYFKHSPKVEIAFSGNLSDHDRNYLGSEIPLNCIPDCILFDRSNLVLNHLQRITQKKSGIEDNTAQKLINKFIYEFESCSNTHRRSDGYQFYFFYNIALHTAIQLNYLAKGNTIFSFLPKGFIANCLTETEQKNIYSLSGSLFLPDGNSLKRKLLDFFYSASSYFLSRVKLEEVKSICEEVYSRDYLWNFRDISSYNSRLKKGTFFRASSLTLIQNDPVLDQLISDSHINTVIDLRADREVLKSGYSDTTLQKINWVHAPFDPWNQSIEFKATHHQGTNVEIAYRFFVLECKGAIKKVIEALLHETKSSVIHCHAGKDRTGIVVSLLHLITEAPLEDIYNDYLASESDTKKEYLDIVLNIIDQHQGIENYLKSCELSDYQIEQLRNKLLE